MSRKKGSKNKIISQKRLLDLSIETIEQTQIHFIEILQDKDLTDLEQYKIASILNQMRRVLDLK